LSSIPALFAASRRSIEIKSSQFTMPVYRMRQPGAEQKLLSAVIAGPSQQLRADMARPMRVPAESAIQYRLVLGDDAVAPRLVDNGSGLQGLCLLPKLLFQIAAARYLSARTTIGIFA
jgi:hypothetical protein